MHKALLFNYTTDIPKDWEFWKTHAELLMSFCKGLIVITMPGWETSVGIKGEIDMAIGLNMSIVYISPDEFLSNSPIDKNLFL